MQYQVNLYLDYIKYQKKLSENTFESYARDLRDFCEFANLNGLSMPSEVSVTDLLRYVRELEAQKKSNATISRIIASIRSFFGYMYDERIIDKNPTRQLQSPKVDRKLPEILTVEEVDRLLSLPDLLTPFGLRDQAMLELLYATGLKVSELISLRSDNINLNLSYVKTTGSQNDRIVPITSSAAKALADYIENGRAHFLGKSHKEEDILFLNASGNPLTRQGFWKIIKAYGNSAEIQKCITPQMLRHSFASHLIQNGADLKSVQEMLGHADLTSTQLYVSVGKDQLKRVYEKTHPRV